MWKRITCTVKTNFQDPKEESTPFPKDLSARFHFGIGNNLLCCCARAVEYEWNLCYCTSELTPLVQTNECQG